MHHIKKRITNFVAVVYESENATSETNERVVLFSALLSVKGGSENLTKASLKIGYRIFSQFD